MDNGGVRGIFGYVCVSVEFVAFGNLGQNYLAIFLVDAINERQISAHSLENVNVQTWLPTFIVVPLISSNLE